MLSTIAIALAVSVLVLGNYMQDSVNYMMAAQFHWVQRYDMSVTTTEAVADRAIYELGSLPGVILCEPNRSISVRLRAGPRHRRVGIMGIRADSNLFGLVNMDGKPVPLPPGGLLVSDVWPIFCLVDDDRLRPRTVSFSARNQPTNLRLRRRRGAGGIDGLGLGRPTAAR